jgi:signal transduction protein with GAF and PtsI domain
MPHLVCRQYKVQASDEKDYLMATKGLKKFNMVNRDTKNIVGIWVAQHSICD